MKIMEKEPGTFGEEASPRGDHGPSVIDRTTRFVAHEVGVDVARSERPGIVQHEAFPHLLFPEGEMACAGVEDDVEAAPGQIDAWRIRDPGVLADFKSETDPAQVEKEVAQRNAPGFDPGRRSLRPRFEPAWFIVETVPREVLFRGETGDSTVDQKGRRVVDPAPVKNGQADGDGEAGGLWGDLLQGLPSPFDHRRGEERVLATVAGDAEFRETKQVDSRGPGPGDGLQDATGVSRPVQRGLVEAGGSGPDAWGTHFPENKRPFGAGSKLDPGAGIMLGIDMFRLVPVLLLWLCVPVQAADPVIAVVDFKKALASHPKARELEAELRATQENARKVFEAKQRELSELQIKLQKASVPLKTKEGDTEENRQAFRDLEERGMEIRQSMIEVQANTRQTIADRQEAVLPELASKVRELVATANNGKYAVVLDASALSRDGLPQVIEAPGAFDLTDRVIALLPVK